MTIATSVQDYKSQKKQPQQPQNVLQDHVDSDSIWVISGDTIRRAIYLLYVLCVAVSAGILYLFPSVLVISGFIVIQLLLIASLYPLVIFTIRTEDHNLVWDQDGWRWSRKSDITSIEYYEQPYRDLPAPTTNHYLSYAFI